MRACGKFVFATFILISANGGTSTDMVVENKYIFQVVPPPLPGTDRNEWQQPGKYSTAQWQTWKRPNTYHERRT